MRRWLCLALLTLSIAPTPGCRRSRASTPPAARRHSRDAELAAARAIMGGGKTSGQGDKKWRDCGVYVDGQPVGVISFGELPVQLRPQWVEEKASAEMRPGMNDPGYKIVTQRRYRFTDYLKAVGVDLAKVKELQVLGPRFSETIVVSGKELRSKKAEGFMFRFGGEVGGKPIPVVPRGFGNEMEPDKLAAVMVYLDKKPPTLTADGLELDGKPVTNVPYFGEPLRGGVRVYQDDKLRVTIKRPMLRQTQPVATSASGEPRYKLWDLLAAHGVDTAHVAEGWLIYSERRTRKLTASELQSLTFVIGEKEKNEILLGDERTPASAIALHKAPVPEELLPHIRPDEDLN